MKTSPGAPAPTAAPALSSCRAWLRSPEHPRANLLGDRVHPGRASAPPGRPASKEKRAPASGLPTSAISAEPGAAAGTGRGVTGLETVETTASATEVWSLLAEPGRWHEWSPYVAGGEGLGDPEVEAGAVGAVLLRGGVRIAAEILAVVPGRSWTWQVKGLRIRHEVEADAVEAARLTTMTPEGSGPALGAGPRSPTASPTALIARNVAAAALGPSRRALRPGPETQEPGVGLVLGVEELHLDRDHASPRRGRGGGSRKLVVGDDGDAAPVLAVAEVELGVLAARLRSALSATPRSKPSAPTSSSRTSPVAAACFSAGANASW